ncbi:MAG: polysaccharide deacetylase family protein [Capsulimonas sp.]|uniref:polysaccharide deacetylase family protein n=1 Tax=Capsulimonas sp. TaxID=2494211 RepID=UPI0032655906
MTRPARWFIVLILAALALPAGAETPEQTKAKGTAPETTVLPKPGLPLNSSPNALSANASLLMVKAERDKYWLNAKTEIYKSTLELIAQRETELDRGLSFSILTRGNPTRKQIALTFDDGPHPAYTPQLLKVLKDNGVKATFFVVGEQAEKYPELIKAEVAAGHSIGNHTYDHVSLIKIPQEYVGTEIKACGEVLERIIGKPVHIFRPPGGVYDRQVAETSEALGYKMILWTDDPGDYASPGSNVIETRTLDHVTNGGIILLHDGIQQTVDVLPQILKYLKGKGYEFVTIEQMIK